VNLKQRFGDWEIDTVAGENSQGAMLTMVERTTALMMIEKLEHGKMQKNLPKLPSDY
jgi:IS30 family transposase